MNSLNKDLCSCVNLMQFPGAVATTIMSHSTMLRLSLNFAQQDELSACARTLALQCATKVGLNHSLTLL